MLIDDIQELYTRNRGGGTSTAIRQAAIYHRGPVLVVVHDMSAVRLMKRDLRADAGGVGESVRVASIQQLGRERGKPPAAVLMDLPAVERMASEAGTTIHRLMMENIELRLRLESRP